MPSLLLDPGLSVPMKIHEMNDFKSDAKIIIVVEKNTVFHRLIQSDLKSCIVITVRVWF